MSVTERLDDFQQRHRWAGLPVAIVYKFHDDQGIYLAALIAHYGFLSLFPLLLLLTSLLGFTLQSNPDLQQRVLDSSVEPVSGHRRPVGKPRRPAGQWRRSRDQCAAGGLRSARRRPHGTEHDERRVGGAAVSTSQSVPSARAERASDRHRRAGDDDHHGAVRARQQRPAFGADLGRLSAVLIIVAAVAVNAAVFVVGFWICIAEHRSVRDLLPGALTAAILWQLLQLVGTAYVAHVVKGAGDTYGVFALVLGLVAWIFLASIVIVFSAEIDVVRHKHLYPPRCSRRSPTTSISPWPTAERTANRDGSAIQGLPVRHGQLRQRSAHGGHS